MKQKVTMCCCGAIKCLPLQQLQQHQHQHQPNHHQQEHCLAKAMDSLLAHLNRLSAPECSVEGTGAGVFIQSTVHHCAGWRSGGGDSSAQCTATLVEGRLEEGRWEVTGRQTDRQLLQQVYSLSL